MAGKVFSGDDLAALNAHTQALNAHTAALTAQTQAMTAPAEADAHAIVYAAMGYPPSANQKTIDAKNISDTDWANSLEYLTSDINTRLDNLTPPRKHIDIRDVVSPKTKTIGDLVALVQNVL